MKIILIVIQLQVWKMCNVQFLLSLQINGAVTASTNGHLPTNYDDDTFCDNKSLMIVKRTGDGSGITALLNRQLQG